MRFFSLSILLASTTLLLSAQEYTIQLIVTKNKASMDSVRKSVELCKTNWFIHVDSMGRSVLTCGKYSSIESARGDIASTRKVVPDAFALPLRLPIESTNQEIKSKPQHDQIKEEIKKEAPLAVSPIPKPKEEAQPSQTDENPPAQEQETQKTQSVQTKPNQTPLRLINVTNDESAQE